MLYEGSVVDEVTRDFLFFPIAPVILRRARSLLLSEIHVHGKLKCTVNDKTHRGRKVHVQCHHVFIHYEKF